MIKPLGKLLEARLGIKLVQLAEWNTIIARNNELLSERIGLQSRVDALQFIKDTLLSERDVALSERDVALSERDALAFERSRFLKLPNSTLMLSRLQRIGALLRPRSVVDYEKIRVGGPHDGGYVCVDDINNLAAALSIGVGPDVSWDIDIAERGLNVLQYDHTVVGPPTNHVNFRFHQVKLSQEDSAGETSLSSLLKLHKLLEPASVIAKIDIEGDEWSVFESASLGELSVFSQIVCEFHWLGRISDSIFFESAIATLSKLTAAFVPVHVHANNSAPEVRIGNMVLPDVIEVTFVNKEKYTTVESVEVFPTSLDAPNSPNLPDFELGHFRF